MFTVLIYFLLFSICSVQLQVLQVKLLDFWLVSLALRCHTSRYMHLVFRVELISSVFFPTHTPAAPLLLSCRPRLIQIYLVRVVCFIGSESVI